MAWRVKSHYRENDGKCFLFGDIVGYQWHQSIDESIGFDIRGNLVDRSSQRIAPPMGTLSIKNKVVAATDEGNLIIRSRSEV